MKDETQTTLPAFDTWCIVELYGRQQIAGKVSERTIAGQGFIQVNVPDTGDQPGYSRLFGPGAIYSMIPTTEEIARAFIARNVGAPIQTWQITPPQLPVFPDDDSRPEDF
ncbi:MAG: acetyltransferase [Anaerolinea sp.]|nr:acetyltransferase [Anaerolinea sp.]